MFAIISLALFSIFSIVQGRPENFVYNGGKPTISGAYHAHLTLHDAFNYTWPGSGVLITSKHVLTLAINIEKFVQWDVGLGSTNRDQLTVITSYNAIIHDDFSDDVNDNNLGVIVLPESVQITDRVAPAPLPIRREDYPKADVVGFILSFGVLKKTRTMATELQQAVEQVLPFEHCQAFYPHLAKCSNHFFCAINRVNPTVCGGDQGAGMIDPESKQLIGLVAFGNLWKNCEENAPIGFVRITKYVPWIRRISIE